MDLLSNSNSLWSHRRTLSPKDSPPSLAIDLFASLLCPRGGEHSRIGKEKRNQPPALLLIPCLLFAVCGRRVVAKKVIVIGLASNAVAVIYWNRFFTPAGPGQEEEREKVSRSENLSFVGRQRTEVCFAMKTGVRKWDKGWGEGIRIWMREVRFEVKKETIDWEEWTGNGRGRKVGDKINGNCKSAWNPVPCKREDVDLLGDFNFQQKHWSCLFTLPKIIY